MNKRQRSEENVVFTTVPNLPLNIAMSTSPQELIYAIVTDSKTFYNKSELLQIIEKLINFISPQFKEECSYIG